MPKKDMGLSLYDVEKDKIVLKIKYAELRQDDKLKQKIRQKLLTDKFKLYCNCNPEEKIEKKIDIALRIYDAKRDTHDKHLYNCAGTPIATKSVDGCYINEDGVLCIDNLAAFDKTRIAVNAENIAEVSKVKENNKKYTNLLTAIKDIHAVIWNSNSQFHYKKATHDKMKDDLRKNKISETLIDSYQNILLFHRKMFMTMQENQIIVNNKDLSSMLYNTSKFKSLKKDDLLYFQMIVSHFSHIDRSKAIFKCINNFGQEETFVVNDYNLLHRIEGKDYEKNIYCIAGFVKNNNGEKLIVDCEVYIPSKRGLITLNKDERTLIDEFTVNNVPFKYIMNFEFSHFFNPVLIYERKGVVSKGEDNNATYEVIYDILRNKETFEQAKEKTEIAKKMGLGYSYWKTDYSKTPYVPKQTKYKKK